MAVTSPPRPPRPLLLTYEQAAEELGVTTRYVEQLARDGAFPVVRLGRLRRIDVTDLERYVANLPRTPAAA
jgi:excisionase family DNA binding protein